MDNVQNCDSYINIPSSQTYRSYTVISVERTACLSLLQAYRALRIEVQSASDHGYGVTGNYFLFCIVAKQPFFFVREIQFICNL
jgi:hypothetical protein